MIQLERGFKQWGVTFDPLRPEGTRGAPSFQKTGSAHCGARRPEARRGHEQIDVGEGPRSRVREVRSSGVDSLEKRRSHAVLCEGTQHSVELALQSRKAPPAVVEVSGEDVCRFVTYSHSLFFDPVPEQGSHPSRVSSRAQRALLVELQRHLAAIRCAAEALACYADDLGHHGVEDSRNHVWPQRAGIQRGLVFGPASTRDVNARSSVPSSLLCRLDWRICLRFLIGH
jgi:hypothetical protein